MPFTRAQRRSFLSWHPQKLHDCTEATTVMTHCHWVNYMKQESLANTKVNARQHWVTLSCLCNSLSQIEWVADFRLRDEDLENIASERYENRHLRRPLSCLMPHIARTPGNICITLISLEGTFTGLHFRHWQYGSICIQIFVVGPNTWNSERIRPYSISRSSKVIDLVNRKPICDFLLVISSNFSHI